MPITVKCSSCGLEGNVPDQFAGKTAKCRKCGGLIPVGVQNGQPAAAISASASPVHPSMPPPPTRARPPASALPQQSAVNLPPLPAQAQWYVAKDGSQLGPFTFDQLKQMAGAGKLSPEDLATRPGDSQWTAAKEIAGLFDAVIQLPPLPSKLPPLPDQDALQLPLFEEPSRITAREAPLELELAPSTSASWVPLVFGLIAVCSVAVLALLMILYTATFDPNKSMFGQSSQYDFYEAALIPALTVCGVAILMTLTLGIVMRHRPGIMLSVIAFCLLGLTIGVLPPLIKAAGLQQKATQTFQTAPIPLR